MFDLMNEVGIIYFVLDELKSLKAATVAQKSKQKKFKKVSKKASNFKKMSYNS